MKLYIITGASRGLGRSIKELLQNKYTVVDISRSSKDFPCDLTLTETIPETLNKVFSQYKIHSYKQVTLINNAGKIKPVALLGNLSTKEIQDNISVNLTAPIVVTNEFLKHTNSYKGKIKIINLTSGAAKSPMPSWPAYSAAKAGLENLSNCILQEQGLRCEVFCINPGLIDTDMQKHIRDMNEKDFPDIERFINFKEQGLLVPPIEVAQRVLKEAKESL